MKKEEEPLRGFIHGKPGTGKSRVILWIRRFFVEALGWEHGVEFVFVAPKPCSLRDGWHNITYRW